MPRDSQQTARRFAVDNLSWGKGVGVERGRAPALRAAETTLSRVPGVISAEVNLATAPCPTYSDRCHLRTEARSFAGPR